jgi:hypothetical protein
MNITLTISCAAAAALLAGCATTSTTQLAWGKGGVSLVDFGTDVGTCTGLAAATENSDNGANTAGGISGKNSTGGRTETASNSGPSVGAAAGSPQTIGGGTYRDMANPDLVQRAANQQRATEMNKMRATQGVLKSCLTQRGYTEFSLTPEQDAHLKTLPTGSREYYEYLYKLGSDPEVVTKQAIAAAK